MSANVFIDDLTAGSSFQDDIEDSPDNLVGELSGGPADVRQRISEDYDQLDEPITETLKRDLSGIYNKMKIIAFPLSSYDIYKIVLRGWDLWGPLILCTFLAFGLHHSDHQGKDGLHSGFQFADVFVFVWFGSCIVSLSYRLLSASSANTYQLSKQIVQPNTVPKFPMQGDQVDQLNPKDQSFVLGTRPDLTHQTILCPPSIFQLVCVFGYCLVAPCFGLILLKIFSFRRLLFERVLIGLIFGFAWPTFCSIKILIRYQHPSKRALAIYPIGFYYFALSCMIIISH